MRKGKTIPAGKAELRRRAEEHMKANKSAAEVSGSAADQQRLLQELQIHQIELEMQNEELTRAREHAEIAQKEAEVARERYMDLYDFAPVGYLTLDGDGVIRQVNLTGASLLGMERSRLLNRRFGLFVSESSVPVFNSFLKSVFEDRVKKSCSITLGKEECQRFHVQIEATISEDGQECRAAVLDVTERKRAEAEMARLASFPILNPDPIIEVDLAGVIHFCNPAAERLFPDLRQCGVEHPLLANWEAIVCFFCESGLKESTRELRINGHWYLETMHFVEVTKRIHIYGRDITLRKEAEKVVIEHTEQLEDANKDLESFGFSIAHDLRGPLKLIAGYSQMILKKDGERFDEEVRRRFQMITDNAETMGRLIDDLLSFSRLGSQAVAKTSLDMEELLREAWQELTNINPGRDMTLNINPMPVALGDRALIRQVYGNLLGNAVKFTQGRDAAVIEAGSCIQDGETVYYVRDNGVGFDMRFYDKLFGVFQRLHSDDEFKGTGIGLALVKRIINRHGGRVWAEGEVDKRATFYFTLPTPQA